MKEVIVGVLGNTMDYSSNVFEHVEKQYVNSKYVAAVEKNGGIPLIIPFINNGEKLYRLINLCDGLLFPGGEDIDPMLYGENPHSKLGEIKPEIDEFLIKAMKYAIKKRIPVFGICKGMQIMAVATGGTLYQDIYEQREGESFLHCQTAKRDYELHSVKIEKNSRLYEVLGTDTIKTNSMHHQSIKAAGSRMKVTAETEDGVVEAMESEDGLLLGVQWHPEEMIFTSKKMNSLFRNLVDRAGKWEDKACLQLGMEK